MTLSIGLRRLVAIVVLAVTTGCQDVPAPMESLPPLDLDFAPCTAAAPLVEASAPPAGTVTGTADLLSEIGALEERLLVAEEAEVPPLLLEIGKTANRLRLGGRNSPEAEYARARPEAFRYNELANGLYTGLHFEELIERYPGSPLADDAAYEMTRLLQGGECEGWIDCYVARGWTPLSEFLEGYPDSPLVSEAVDRALEVFRQVGPDGDLRLSNSLFDLGRFDSDRFRDTLESLDGAARGLPPTPRTRLLERAGQLWWQYAEYERSRSAYRAALAGTDSDTSACLENRLDSLPAEWFTLDPARVINANRVELAWSPPDADSSGYVVFRSGDRADEGTAIARLSADETAWADRGTSPDSVYWYRVVAEAADRAVPSNPSAARTPSLRPGVRGIAVSTENRYLHIFGVLENLFPQVLRIPPDGSAVERRDAEFVGFGGAETRYTAYVDEVWIAEEGGAGVLGFAGEAGRLPAELTAAARMGSEHIADYPNPDRRVPLLVSIDEASGAAWIERGGGFLGAWIAIDCVERLAICWLGQNGQVSLRNGAGEILMTYELPGRDPNSWADTIYADPRDGSAWIVFRPARLVHVDRDGNVLADLELVPALESYAFVVTADLDGDRAVWYTRIGPERRTELMRIDLDDPGLNAEVVASGVPSLPLMAPDLEGGVWLVTRDAVLRFNGNGEAAVTLDLGATGGD